MGEDVKNESYRIINTILQFVIASLITGLLVTFSELKAQVKAAEVKRQTMEIKLNTLEVTYPLILKRLESIDKQLRAK